MHHTDPLLSAVSLHTTGATPLPPDLDKRLAFTPPEFAGACGRHKAWAYRKIHEGRIKVVRDAGRILIPVAEVRRFLADTVLHGVEPVRGGERKGTSSPRRPRSTDVQHAEGAQ